jgi:hypothetical protein
MAQDNTLPSDQERRAYMLKLKAFRETLSPREQRMLDATVLASFWPAGSAEVEGYRLLPIDSIYDEGWTIPPLNDTTPWVKFFTIA